MNITRAMRFAAFLCAAVLATAGAAQQAQQPAGKAAASQQPSSSQPKDQSKPASSAPIAGEIPLGITIAETVIVQRGFRASKLMKADVYNDQTQKIGKIDDFVVAPDGKLTTAILEVGGFLGMGTHRVAIPLDQFTEISTKKVVLPGASKEELKKLPEFKYV